MEKLIGKPVLLYVPNCDNVYVFSKRYETAAIAARENNCASSSIANVCRGKDRLCKNMVWRWESDISDITKPITIREKIKTKPNGPMYKREMTYDHKEKLRKINIELKGRKIIQKSLETGEILNIFDSISMASLYILKNKDGHGNIVACLNNRRKSAYGFKWEYFDGEK